MIKYLLLALVIIWLFYSPALRKQFKRTGPVNQKANSPQQPQVMLTCAHCGAHFPKDDAVAVTQGSRTQYFCCAEHMRAGPQQG